ncbi:tandem-95 repeat protein, partial [Mesorhizobium opportunistum]|uniref:beta strand repeat-containing protein n=1 Tax=Mesorhizobium opportunistum TaxID=593909 RepID=UPI0033372D3D
MTTNIELDTAARSWDEHSAASDHHGQTSPAEIQVAQAASTQQAAPAAAEPVPVDVGSGVPVKPEAPAEAKAPAAAAPHEYVADANHVVKLPANVSIDNIKVDGHNLVLEQADGSVIVIKDGALNVPTFLIGDVEVPRVALIAALEASHVDVAFGADGSMSAGPGGSTSSAGGDFSVPAGGIGDGFGLSALLPPTDLAFGQPDHRELFPSLLPDSTPLIIDLTPSVDGGDTIVNEKGLPASSGSEGSGEAAAPGVDGDTSEHNTGTFTITSPDGVGSVTIAGQVISGAALANSASTPIDITTPLGNTLTINGYDASTGQVSYSYTLLHSETHPAGSDPIFDNMTVTVTDTDGDVSLPGTLSVQIVDDVPTAHNDVAAQAGEDAPVTVNVFANDVPGADGVNIADPTKVAYVANSLTGGGGTVTYNNDGTFTYTPTAGEEGTVTFQYRIVDGDGDASVATVTINLLKDSTPTIDVTPQNPDASGHSAANEAGLPPHDGLPAGSGEIADNDGTNNSDTSETTTGTLTITTGSDTIGHLYVTDKDSTQIEVTNAAGGILVHGQYGDLTITGTPATGYTYSYTLLDSTTGNGTHDDFAVKVVDSDGDPASTTLTIDIVNDVPTAHDDTDAAQSGETVTGNVETGASTHGTGAADTAGADGIASIAWTGVAGTTVTGTYGVLTVDANGGYSYHANPNISGVDVFNYTITDGDGGTSPATLTITVANGQPQPVAATAQVDEAALDTTTDAGDVAHGTVAGSDPSSAGESVTGSLALGDPNSPHVTNIAGATSSAVGAVAVIVQGTYGVLQIDADGHYTYTLTKPYDTMPDNNDGTNIETGKDVFTYTVTDAYGNTNTSTISIDIKDDVPTAHADTDAAQSGEIVTGNVETGASTHGTGAADTAGADGIASIAWTGSVTDNGVTTVTGTHGVLTVFANGDYSYQATPNTSGTDTFTYTITDGDGDTSPATLTITVAGSAPSVTPETATIDEAALDTITDPGDLGHGTVTGSTPASTAETVTGTLTYSDPDGPVTVTGVAVGNSGADVSGNVSTTIAGTYGLLTVDAAGHYTYTLTTPYTTTPAQNNGAETEPGKDVFTFTVTDALGNTSTSTISIDIKDDVPSIVPSGTGVSLSVDESYLANGSTPNAALTVATGNFSGAFTA